MRVLRTENFGNYVAYEQEPSWMLSDHYDFCDEFIDSKYTEKKKGFFAVLLTALHTIL